MPYRRNEYKPRAEDQPSLLYLLLLDVRWYRQIMMSRPHRFGARIVYETPRLCPAFQLERDSLWFRPWWTRWMPPWWDRGWAEVPFEEAKKLYEHVDSWENACINANNKAKADAEADALEAKQQKGLERAENYVIKKTRL